MVFAADVHSVFDICWFTLAKKLSEDVTPEEKGTSADVKPAHQGMVMSCPFCGEAYIRTANRAVTCGKLESLELTMDKHGYNYIMQTLQLLIRIEMSSRAFH